jgi:hypothetical protein
MFYAEIVIIHCFVNYGGKMLIHIRKVPVEKYSVEKDELDKIKFPAMTEEILDIYIEDEETGTVLTYKDDVFADAKNEKASKSQVIYITFIMQTLEHIKITLKISDIFQYFCGIKDLMIMRAYRKRYDYGLGGTRIYVMDRSDYIDESNSTKYIINIRDDVLDVDANNVVISDVSYLDD